MLKALLLLSAISLLLSACSSNYVVQQVKSPLPALNTTMFAAQSVPRVKDIFYLSDAQQDDFVNYYFDQSRQDIPGNIRLFEYLEKFVEGFNFYGVTLKASEALEQKNGNCLTLAIVTKALADVVGLETAFQRVNSAPVYARYADIMTLSSHVRTYVYEPKASQNPAMIIIRRASVIIDYFPTSSDVAGYMLEPVDFMAMYYQNLAAEALLAHQYDYAFALLRQGLTLNHANPETLNTLAVLFNKLGESAQSEKLYRYILDNNIATANVIANYAGMLRAQGRLEEAKKYAAKIDNIEEDNPYRWIDLGDKAFNAGEYNLAEKYYKKANKLAPYVHESQFGLAKSYYQLGQLSLAKEALAQAIEADYRADHKSLYQAKLQTLSTEQQR